MNSNTLIDSIDIIFSFDYLMIFRFIDITNPV